jgi:hypothetical protein
MQYPPAVALHQLTVTPFLEYWLSDQKNRSDIPRRMEACGYEKLPNPDTKDGLWKMDGRYRVLYGLASMPIAARMAAARLLAGRPTPL